MNDELLAVNIIKTATDVSPSTIDVTVLDVEKLLLELAEVVGLEESDVATLRRDLDAMRPSERAGFLSEVIKQERARRARAIAEAEVAAEPSVPAAEVSRKLTEEELEYLHERLKAMGIEDTEADLMVEQAKNLTKAEVDALLDQIGGREE
jgi:Mg/Co/Ni transporter MgtE